MTIKICVLNPNFYRSSGVTIAIKNIHLSLANEDIENYFAVCNSGITEEDDGWVNPKRLIRLSLMSLNLFKILASMYFFIIWLREKEIDVVHIHHRRLFVIMRIFSSFFKGSLLYTGHLPYKFSLIFWLFSPHNASAITASVLNNILDMTRARRVCVIGNPTAFPGACPIIDLKSVEKNAICIARFESVKGHTHLINAWSELIKKGYLVKLSLVGEGTLRRQLEQQVAFLGLGDFIEFKGYISNIEAELSKCLFSILVSEIEGQGIVTIESAAAGRASLLTNVEGSRDCLPSNRRLSNGIAFGDVSGLANALESWFSQPSEVVKEGKVFFDFHKSENSFEVLSKKYFAL